TSTPPKVSCARAARVSTSATRPVWQATASASPPLSRISLATASTPSSLRLASTSFAPAAARAAAIAAPIPREAPVTMATRPVRSNREGLDVCMTKNDILWASFHGGDKHGSCHAKHRHAVAEHLPHHHRIGSADPWLPQSRCDPGHPGTGRGHLHPDREMTMAVEITGRSHDTLVALAIDVACNEDELSVVLSDGRTVTVP